MDTHALWARRLLGAGLGLIAILALATPTGWLVRMQLATMFRVPAAPVALVDAGVRDLPMMPADAQRVAESARSAYAAAHPGDFPVQLARALDDPPKATVRHWRIDRLRPLQLRFGDQPSLYANLLRFWTMDSVLIHRDEEDALFAPGQPHYKYVWPAPDPRDLAQFDADAADAERLDADNAYFPAMRAVGLFAARRDDEAGVELLRAASLPSWREYYDDEIFGQWELADRAVGDPSALTRMVYAACELFPHYAQLRALARIAVVRAVEAERAGRTEDGIVLREAVIHIGSLMRRDGQSLIGNLVGIAITNIAIVGAGGEAPGERPPGVTSEQWTQARRDRYMDYLERADHHTDAAQARAEFAACDRASSLIHRGLAVDTFNRIGSLGGWWISAMLAVTNALWLLLLGGAASAAARSRFFLRGRAVPWHVRLGAIAGAAILIAMAVLIGIGHRAAANGLGAVAAAAAVAALTMPRLRHTAAAVAASAVGLAVGSVATVWTCANVLVLTRVYAAASGVLENLGFSGLRQVHNGRELVYFVGLIGVVPILPVLLGAAAAVVSILARKPLSIGFIAAFRRWGVTLGAAMCLLYGVLAVGTVRAERSSRDSLEASLRQGGRYIADQLGESWPE